jgi:hypothetical protein
MIAFGVAAVAVLLWAIRFKRRKGYRGGDVADLFEAVEVGSLQLCVFIVSFAFLGILDLDCRSALYHSSFRSAT